MRAPRIAVCVTTRDRAWLLPRLVEALEQQTLPPEEFEVVVTDNGSLDDTWDVLQALAAESPLQVQVVRNPRGGGPSAGRNAAWRRTTAPRVAFTDDDCVPAPQWLASHVEALEDADITQGQVEVDREAADRAGPFGGVVAVDEENGLYETCNVAYRRSWLEKLDGFDESYRWVGEDADLAWRAKKLGATSAFVPGALVHHDVKEFSWRTALRATRQWEGVVELVARHPHLRPLFGRGPTWRQAHPWALLASGGVGLALGAVISRRWVLLAPAAVVAGPYVDYRFRRVPIIGSRRARIRLLPVTLGIDMSELLVICGARARLWMRNVRTGRRADRAGSSL